MSTFAVRLTRPGQRDLYVVTCRDDAAREVAPPALWVEWTDRADQAASYDWPTAMDVARMARRSYVVTHHADAAITVEPIKPVPA